MYKHVILIFFVFTLLSCTHIANFKKVGLSPKHYVIIGCSAAGYHAALELARLDKDARITCISDESSHAYKKPALKSFISKTKNEEQILLKKSSQSSHIKFLLDTKVLSLNRQLKSVTLSNGKVINYDKLLIATGASPYVPMNPELALVYNSKKDVDTILALIAQHRNPKVLIVGAGIRSLELAHALKQRYASLKLVILNRSAHFLGNSGDEKIDEFIKKRLNFHNIEFMAPMSIQKITKTSHGLFALLNNQKSIAAHVIIFALGTIPNSDIAQEAGLKLYDNLALKVDAELKTSDSDIYAAGDVTGYKTPLSLRELRSNKWSDAKKQGIIAAQNMSGQHQRYEHKNSVHKSSFFGLKILISGDVRTQSQESSIIMSGEYYYYRFIVHKNRLKAFALLWDSKQKSPPIFQIRKKFIEQSVIKPEDLLTNI